MQKFQVSIYPARDKTFLVSFVHPLTKRRIRHSFTSREQAESFKSMTEKKFKRKNPESYRDLNIEELVVLLVNEQPKSEFNRRKCHLIDFIDTFGQFKLEQITTDALKVWLDQVQRENNLKDISMRSLKCDIDTLFTYLEKKEVISESPLKGIYYEKVAPPLKARNILSEFEIKKLLSAIKDYSPGYLYPLIKMYAETGAKKSEVLELKWKDLNLQDGIVQFNQGSKIQQRKLGLSDELVKILSKRKRESSLVFLTYYKEPFTSQKLARAVTEFKRTKAYKGDWTPTDLRHSYAVNYLASGGDLRELQRILGHNSIHDTRRLYGAATTPEVAKNITNPFEQL